MNHQQVYEHIHTEMAETLSELQKAVAMYEIEKYRTQLTGELNGTINSWIHATCAAFHTNFKSINVYTRETPVPFIRQVVFWGLCMQVVPNSLSLAQIGALIPAASKDGTGMDHATVLHAKRTVNDVIDTEPANREIIRHLVAAFGWKLSYNEETKSCSLYRAVIEALETDKTAA